jgi:hypothetical protein
MLIEGAAGSAAKVIFGPMINVLTTMYSTWRSNRKEDQEYREKVFKEEFLPAFERLEAIHTNYLTSFHDFYEVCRKFETPPYDLLAKFRRYGIEYSGWREDVRCFVDVCGALAKNHKLKKEREAIEEFANAIKHYFEVTSPDGGSEFTPTWFSDFLSKFESLVRTGQSPWDASYEGYGFGSDPKGTLMGYLRTVYQTELPARWARVSKAKAALQIALLSPR